MKKQLLVISKLFYPELISTGQSMTELCEVLTQKGYQIKVLCCQPNLNEFYSKTSRKMYYKEIFIRRMWSTTFSKRFFMGNVINNITFSLSSMLHIFRNRKFGPLLILSTPSILPIICGFMRKMGGPEYILLVTDVHPDRAENANEMKKNGLTSKLWNKFTKFGYENASYLVSVGRCMNKVLTNKVSKETKKLIKHIHIWCDDRYVKYIKPHENELLRSWKLEDKFVCLYSGNMAHYHDMMTILKTAKALNGNSFIQFVFVGDGDQKEQMLDYVKNEQLTNCQFHEYVARHYLSHVLSCAHIGLVSLQSGQEGFSVPSKTYGLLATETPVIGIMNHESEIAKLITEEKCGKLIQPGDVDTLKETILTLSTNTDEMIQLGKNGLSAIQKNIVSKKPLQNISS